jgi:hypothetical protein
MHLHHVVSTSWIYKENNNEEFNSSSASSAPLMSNKKYKLYKKSMFPIPAVVILPWYHL